MRLSTAFEAVVVLWLIVMFAFSGCSRARAGYLIE